MARKTFVSYKYSEARKLRDKIIESLGKDADFYKGETSDSPALDDLNTGTIRETLKDMIFGTSVMIVILSPQMKESKWIDWEIAYALKEYKRNARTSHTNGVVGVIMKVNGGYSWLKTLKDKPDGCRVAYYDTDKLYSIINKNRFNKKEKVYSCGTCKCVPELEGSYISFVTEERFLSNPSQYIENAYEKSQSVDDYDIVKEA